MIRMLTVAILVLAIAIILAMAFKPTAAPVKTTPPTGTSSGTMAKPGAASMGPASPDTAAKPANPTSEAPQPAPQPATTPAADAPRPAEGSDKPAGNDTIKKVDGEVKKAAEKVGGAISDILGR